MSKPMPVQTQTRNWLGLAFILCVALAMESLCGWMLAIALQEPRSPDRWFMAVTSVGFIGIVTLGTILVGRQIFRGRR